MHEDEIPRLRGDNHNNAGFVPNRGWRQVPGGWRGNRPLPEDYETIGDQRGYRIGFADRLRDIRPSVESRRPSRPNHTRGFSRPNRIRGLGRIGRGGNGSDGKEHVFGLPVNPPSGPFANLHGIPLSGPAPPDPVCLSRNDKTKYSWTIKSSKPTVEDGSLVLDVSIVLEGSSEQIPVSAVIDTHSVVNLMNSTLLSQLSPRDLTITELSGRPIQRPNISGIEWIHVHTLAKHVLVLWKQEVSSGILCNFYVPSTWEYGDHELVLGNEFVCNLSTTDVLNIPEVNALVRKLICDPKHGRMDSGFRAENAEMNLGLDIQAEEQGKTDQFLKMCSTILKQGSNGDSGLRQGLDQGVAERFGAGEQQNNGGGSANDGNVRNQDREGNERPPERQSYIWRFINAITNGFYSRREYQ